MEREREKESGGMEKKKEEKNGIEYEIQFVNCFVNRTIRDGHWLFPY